MLSAIGRADRVLFQRINGAWTNPWLDAWLPAVTDLHRSPVGWIIFAAALALWLRAKGRFGARVLLVLALAVGVSDVVCYRVIKPSARRLRPAVAGVPATTRAPAGGKYGMPSNHASNTAAAAIVLGTAEPHLLIPLWAVVAVVSYSRVYCGVHYPLDVAVGMAVGSFIGIICALIFGLRQERDGPNDHPRE